MGNEASSCFQVICFPEWWFDKSKSHGNRGGEQQGRGRGTETSGCGRGDRSSGFRAHNAHIGESGDTLNSGIPDFTFEQWASLASFVNNQKQASTSDNLSGKKEQLYFYGTNSRFDIVIDSGASHHMTGDINLLTDVVTIAPCPITMPNRKLTWATRHGCLDKSSMHHTYLLL